MLLKCFVYIKTVSLVSDATTATKTSQSSILMLCVCQTLIKALLTYFQSRDPGIGNFSIPDPGIEKTIPGLQTLIALNQVHFSCLSISFAGCERYC